MKNQNEQTEALKSAAKAVAPAIANGAISIGAAVLSAWLSAKVTKKFGCNIELPEKTEE